MLDISVEKDLKDEFAMADFINIIKHALALLGTSDDDAHTNFPTLGTYPTHFLVTGCVTLPLAGTRLSRRSE